MTLLVRNLDLCRCALQVRPPGQDDWDAQRARSYGDVDAIFMCFSVISPSSFEHIRSKARLCSLHPFPRSFPGADVGAMQWVTEWRRHRPDTPVVLIGTKKDMRTDPELLRRLADKGLAPITTAQGTRLC